MAFYYSAQIYQEYSGVIKDLALNLNIPQENIVFKPEGCPLGLLGVYIKFQDEQSLSEFKEKINDYVHCVNLEW